VNAISIRGLRRTYGSRKGLFAEKRTTRDALKGIDLDVRAGELFGLLGPNGAGKTTLVKILATVLLPSSGTVEVLGLDAVRDVHAIRSQIGLVFGGERGLYGGVSARDTLLFWAAMYRLPGGVARTRTDDALARVGLAQRASDRVETFSRGMKQRLHLARGLLSQPRLLLLDEPTVGLDPVAARDIRGLIGELNRGGTTIFLTTHYMGEAEALCNRVAFITGGSIIAVDEPRVLTRVAAEMLEVEADIADRLVDELSHDLGAAGFKLALVAGADAGRQRVSVSGAQQEYGRLLELFGRHGAARVNTKEPSLEDVYVRLVGSSGIET
jgi:ABC-2 type transport system ATP-binding protein